MMTEDEAIAEAERAAEPAGYRLDAYDQAEVTSDDRCWRVFYRLKPPGRRGGDFSVRVKEPGVSSIIHGQ